MGRIEVDWEWFMGPLEWSTNKAKESGIGGQLALLFFGLGYLLVLTCFLVLMLPIVWIMDQLS
tara:strand:+ start:3668 stop:3856 length:189 start_codon:yes stop_codon:yes gene_type:complete